MTRRDSGVNTFRSRYDDSIAELTRYLCGRKPREYDRIVVINCYCAVSLGKKPARSDSTSCSAEHEKAAMVGEGFGHGYCSFSVLKLRSTSSAPTIQKRTTTLFSCHPDSSK